MTNPRTGRRPTLPFVFWNILGGIGLGFSWLVLISNLTVVVRGSVRDFAEGREAWDMLANDSIPMYGFILMVASGSVFVLVGRRVIDRKIMGYSQIVVILAIVSIPILWYYLAD